MNKKIKTAVVLYGYCRTYKTTVNSLIKNVLEPNNADLFVFTYDNAGVSILSKDKNINREKLHFGNQWDMQGEEVSEKTLSDVYGTYLKKAQINKYNPEKFIKDSQGIFSPILKIERVYSLYWNITNAIAMLLEYSSKHKITYDAVILARPDLFFFKKIDLSKMDLSKINVPQYGGNLINKLEKPEPYYAAYYENIELGEYIPYRSVIFSDQLIISSFENMKGLALLYHNLAQYEQNSLPVCHPETVLYYHLVYKPQKEYCNYEILYEILRENYIKATNEFKERSGSSFPHKGKKSIKYKIKAKNDFCEIKKGGKVLLIFPLHLFKYLFYKIRGK